MKEVYQKTALFLHLIVVNKDERSANSSINIILWINGVIQRSITKQIF